MCLKLLHIWLDAGIFAQKRTAHWILRMPVFALDVDVLVFGIGFCHAQVFGVSNKFNLYFSIWEFPKMGVPNNHWFSY